jgi:hypothetical protein
MKQRKLYVGTLAVGVAAVVIGGFQDYRTLPWLLGGMAGLLLLLRLAAAASRWRPALRINPKLALVLVSTFISFLLAEAILQVLFSHYFPPIFSWYSDHYDSTLGWFPVRNRYIPSEGDTATNNSMGFPGREFQRTGKVGIMFLGDSFVWGYGVAEPEARFTGRIQARHPEWDIYGVGVNGYGTDQELLLLQRIFDQLKPRIVFLNFCTQNDHENNSANMSYGHYKPHFTSNAAGVQLHGVPVPCAERVRFAAHPLLARSDVFQLFVRVWKRFTLPPMVTHDDPTPALILEMQKYVQAKGACFVVGLTAPDPEIERLLQHAGIPSLDLTTRYTLDKDYHWSKQGHSFVADRVEQFFLTNATVSRALR